MLSVVKPSGHPEVHIFQKLGVHKCFRCGSNEHLAIDKNCPAASVQCNNCGKTGHFAKVCRSSAKTVNQIQEVVVPELAILCVDDVKVAAAAK